MARPIGTNKVWNTIRDLQDFRSKYVQKILDNIEAAVKIHEKNVNDPDAPANAALSGANFFTSEYKALDKEYKNSVKEDFADKSLSKPTKKEKHKGNGIIDLEFNEKTGTDN